MNLHKLKVQRDAQRDTIRKYLQRLDEAKSKNNMVQFDTIFKSLENKVTLLTSINEEILSKTDVADLHEEVVTTDEYSLDFELLMGDLRDFKESSAQCPIPPPADSLILPATHSSIVEVSSIPFTTNTSSSISSQLHKLPKLELPHFDDDILTWQTFWDSYETSVHQNPNLTDVKRFAYLKSQLHGDAARTLEGFALTNANYSRAVDLLRDRFGQTQEIVHATMQALLNLPGRNTVYNLRHFCDKMEAYIRGLESLGKYQESYGTLRSCHY
jgi:hypothetical protein